MNQSINTLAYELHMAEEILTSKQSCQPSHDFGFEANPNPKFLPDVLDGLRKVVVISDRVSLLVRDQQLEQFCVHVLGFLGSLFHQPVNHAS